MKQKPTQRTPQDTPATRKKRLQQRLREMNVRNEQEMSALMKSIEKIRSTFRSKKTDTPQR